MEIEEPKIAATAILNGAVKTCFDSKLHWRDMACLIEFYGIESLFQQPEVPGDWNLFVDRAGNALRKGAQRSFLQRTEFQRLVDKYVLDTPNENFRSVLNYIMEDHRRNRAMTAQQALGKQHLEEAMQNLGNLSISSENSDSQPVNNADAPLSQETIPMTPPAVSESGMAPPDVSDNTTSNDELSPRSCLQTFKRLLKAGDIVRHMQIGSFWLQCDAFMESVRDAYVHETGRRISPENYRYVLLLFQHLRSNPSRREIVLGNFADIFKEYIKKYGELHLNKVNEIAKMN